MIPFASVVGLGGGMELGIISTNEFELVHRTGSVDLGAPIPEANRKLFGWNWTSNFTGNPDRWQRVDVPFISSCPPCSAWSTLTSQKHRGEGAKVLACTDEVFAYSAFLKHSPEIIALESVQQAFSLGRPYYQRKRLELEEKTGHQYSLIWLFQSNQALGGASTRKRVFVVLTRVPFGVEYAQPARITRFGDAIRDLEGLQLTSQKQPYRRPATWWSSNLRSADGVDGHFNGKQNAWYKELMDMAADQGEPWLPREPLQAILKRVYEKQQKLPHEWMRNIDKLQAKDFQLGINQTTCWDPEKQGSVVTGAGPTMSVHYREHRLLTHRETFRLQGWADTVRLWPVRDYNKLSAIPGKGVPVHAGHWLGTWVANSLNGNPGTVLGENIGERERKVDITHSWKFTAMFDAPWRFAKNTINEQRHFGDYNLVDVN